jgi:predicted membrane protein
MAKSSNLVPLLVLFVFVAIAAAVGFIAYSIATEVSDKAAKKMERKNISFSKEGMKVGVKEITTEDISDSTQSYVFSTELWGRFETADELSML